MMNVCYPSPRAIFDMADFAAALPDFVAAERPALWRLISRATTKPNRLDLV
jgi:hypothetical protein